MGIYKYADRLAETKIPIASMVDKSQVFIDQRQPRDPSSIAWRTDQEMQDAHVNGVIQSRMLRHISNQTREDTIALGNIDFWTQESRCHLHDLSPSLQEVQKGHESVVWWVSKEAAEEIICALDWAWKQEVIEELKKVPSPDPHFHGTSFEFSLQMAKDMADVMPPSSMEEVSLEYLMSGALETAITNVLPARVGHRVNWLRLMLGKEEFGEEKYEGLFWDNRTFREAKRVRQNARLAMDMTSDHVRHDFWTNSLRSDSVTNEQAFIQNQAELQAV